MVITTDADFITKCILANYDWLTDDGSPEKEFYFPPFSDSVLWVRADDYGVFLLEKKNHVMHECHTALLPNARGKAVEIGKAAIAWAFNNTDARRIITAVPESNPLALRMALKVGFVLYGINPDSFCKHGKLYSQKLLGINKEAICQQRS